MIEPAPIAPSVNQSLKHASVIQFVGADDSACRQRADRVMRELIEPVCNGTAYKPIRSLEIVEDTRIQPIISDLATSPLVIVDLGLPPFDANVLMEMGFRIANGRPILFLVDKSIPDDLLPLHLRDRDGEIIRINSGEPTDENRRKLTQRIKRQKNVSHGWQSHYPMLEISVPLGATGQTKFVSVNEAAATLYGFDDPEELLSMSVESADERLKEFMPKIQRDAFTKDQERLFGQAVKRSNRSPALAEIPAWLPGHPIQNQQSCIYWPILLQQRFSQEEDQRESVVMRVAFVPVEPWDAWGPMFRVLEKTLRMPDFFRKPKFKYDVFLSYNSKDREIVSAFAATLKKFDLTVWYDEDDLSDREGITPNLKEAMFDSRIIAAVLGRHGLGPWQDRVELRNSLTNIIKGKKPFALLLTSELNTENDSWHQQVPAPFKDVFLDRLYVPLPPVEELKAFANLPQGRNFSLVQRMIKLLADAIHAD